jgi:hypothetical protein
MWPTPGRRETPSASSSAPASSSGAPCSRHARMKQRIAGSGAAMLLGGRQAAAPGQSAFAAADLAPALPPAAPCPAACLSSTPETTPGPTSARSRSTSRRGRAPRCAACAPCPPSSRWYLRPSWVSRPAGLYRLCRLLGSCTACAERRAPEALICRYQLACDEQCLSRFGRREALCTAADPRDVHPPSPPCRPPLPLRVRGHPGAGPVQGGPRL